MVIFIGIIFTLIVEVIFSFGIMKYYNLFLYMTVYRIVIVQYMLDSPVKSFSAVFDMAMAACLT